MGLREQARNRFWAEVLVHDRACEGERPWGMYVNYPAEVPVADTATVYSFTPVFTPSGETASVVYETDSGLITIGSDGTFTVTGAGTGDVSVRAYSPDYPALQQVLHITVTGDMPGGDFNNDFNNDFRL